jgi:hypothetical protein
MKTPLSYYGGKQRPAKIIVGLIQKVEVLTANYPIAGKPRASGEKEEEEGKGRLRRLSRPPPTRLQLRLLPSLTAKHAALHSRRFIRVCPKVFINKHPGNSGHALLTCSLPSR